MAAETFYVCQGGDGTLPLVNAAATAWDADDLHLAGSWANPKVAGKVGPGDTVYFMSDGGTITGTGTPELVLIRASGDSGSPITLTGDGSAILDGESTRYVIHAVEKEYITIDNLEIQNGKWYNIFFYDCNHCIFTNNEVHDCLNTTSSNGSLLVTDSSAGVSADFVIRYNYFHDTTEDHLLYLAHDDHVIEYNIFSGGKDSAIKWNTSLDKAETGNIVRYNYFVDNGYCDIDLCTTDGAQIYCNIFMHTDYGGALEHRYGILLGDPRTTNKAVQNTNIWNNVFYGYARAMICMESYFDAIDPCISELNNNIFHILGGSVDGPAAVDQHFIQYTVAAAVIIGSDYNLFYNAASPMWERFGEAHDTTLTMWKSGSGMDTNSIMGNPLFTDVANKLFSLTATSPALHGAVTCYASLGLATTARYTDFGNVGSVTLAAYNLTTPDMGAYATAASQEPTATSSRYMMIYG